MSIDDETQKNKEGRKIKIDVVRVHKNSLNSKPKRKSGLEYSDSEQFTT